LIPLFDEEKQQKTPVQALRTAKRDLLND